MRIAALTPGQLEPEQSALYEQIAGGPRASGPFRLVEEDGSLTGPFNVLLHATTVGDAIGSLGEAIRYRTSLDDRVREIAILVVAVVAQSPFEWYAHERVARRIGMSDGELAAIRDLDNSGFSGTEAVVLDLAIVLAQGRRVEADLYERAEQALGAKALVELGALVGYYQLLAGLMALFDVSVPVGEEDPFANDSHDQPLGVH